MLYIQHRINTIKGLNETPTDYGVEIDLRTSGSDLILSHDPFSYGEKFIDWIKEYKHQMIILNVKEEGLEESILEILRTHDVQNFFFLDMSFPFMVKYFSKGFNKMACRFSEYESFETIKNLKAKTEWVWVDCFHSMPLSREQFVEIKKMNFKLCLVSPELVTGKNEKIVEYFNIIRNREIEFDAVCTKSPESWKMLLKSKP